MRLVRNNLIVFALVVASFVRVANAAQVVVFEAPLDNWNQEISASFAANRELGRAWIDVQVETTHSGEEPMDRQIISKAVKGLYYDSSRKQVLYRIGTEAIVCAEDAGFLWTTYLKKTGHCLLTPRIEPRKMDDGFRIREQTVAKVVFDAQTSTASHASN